MTCDAAHTHLPDHLAGTLPTSVAAELGAHLRRCDDCAAEYAALEDTWQRLDAIPPAEPDRALMWSRFEMGLQQWIDHQDSHVPQRHAARYGMQFAAAAALIILGVSIGRQSLPPSTSDAQLVALRDELRDMREMVAISLLQQQSAIERLKGVARTNQIDEPGMSLTSALLDVLMHDSNVNVRVSVIDALKRLADREDVRRGALEALSRQTSPIVQVALIELVVEMNPSSGAAVLRRLAEDPMVNDTVRMRARLGLQQLRASA